MRKRCILIIALLITGQLTADVFAQGTRSENPPPPPPRTGGDTLKVKQKISTEPDSLGVYELMQVENLPEFPGGQEGLQMYLRKNLMYPEIEREANVQGRVYVQFIVEVDGTISNVAIIRGVSRGLDMEAIRVVKRMPKWIPAKCNDKCVRVRYIQPISFRIAN